MAARANLKVTKELQAAFVAAQDAKQRYLIIKIKEEKLVLQQQSGGTDDQKSDFDSLAEKIGTDEAAFITFQLMPSKWIFIAFVPDTAHVRDKMMYASSTDDLCDQLGKQFFVGTHKCSEKEELSFQAWEKSTKPVDLQEIMTPKERLLREEALIDKTKCATGMKVVPFKMVQAVVDALAELKSGSRTVVEMKISKKEKCMLGAAKSDASAVEVAAAMTEPRYLVIANSNSKPTTYAFVFSCPDHAKPMLKMLYATAKQAIMTHVEERGLTVAARIEIAESSELAAALDHAFKAKEDIAPAESHALVFKKPVARRRRKGGRRGLIKKPGTAKSPVPHAGSV